MPSLRFPDGVATPSGAYVVIQVTDDNGRMVPGSLYADYRFGQETHGFGTDWPAISICYSQFDNATYAVGENGEVVRLNEAVITKEIIAPPADGPATQGPIREVRAVGNDVYAVGMGRQVYVRSPSDGWRHIDTGVLDSSGRVTSGLTSITGDGSGFLVAVGYDGEIWEHRARWERVQSPTNLLLTRVVRHTSEYYCAGIAGTLLRRNQHGWGVVQTGSFGLDIWDLESFRGILYLGTSDGLFWMAADGNVEPAETHGMPPRMSCASLSADEHRLWCFGGERVASTDDGLRWREESVLQVAE